MMDCHDRWSRIGAEDRVDPDGLIHHLSEGGGEMKKLFGSGATLLVVLGSGAFGLAEIREINRERGGADLQNANSAY